MRRLHLFTTLLFSTVLMLSSLSGQSVSVYATLIDQEVKGSMLDVQEYELVEDGVVNYNNGEWVAVKLEVPPDLAKEDNFIYLSYALLDTVELWVPDQNNQLVRAYQTGQAFKFNTRPYASSDFVFPMSEGTEVYYFRIYSSKPVVLPFQVLYRGALIETLTTKDLLFGVYMGIMLVMFLYNLVLLIITRNQTYGYYILFLITLLLAQVALFGYTDRYLMPNWPALNQKYTVLSGAVVGVFTALFMMNFLQLRQRAPLFAKMVFLLATMEVFGMLFLGLDWDVTAFHWVNMTSLYGSIVGIIAAIKLARTGFKPAKFFLIAWSVFLVSVIIFVFNNLGIIPYKPYFHGAMLFGSGIEVVLLSVALADRISVLRKENEASQKKALEMAQENERIIREQNIILEEKVQQRTEALQATNKELQATLDDLKSAQSQLVQSEKMASLGVLTAGVAHELNNPLNYIHGGYIAINSELEGERSDISKDDLKEYLQWIQSGAEKAIRIVKSLNIYSRKSEDYTESCNLNSIIEDCLSILQHKTRGQLEINKALSDELGTIKGNSGKLHQVVLNLIDNAIDAIEQNGIINITTKTKGHSAILTIEDNGAGISQEHLDKVLDPFFTTKPPGKGTGLGLSIVHSIIQEHAGRIHFDSEPGQGTTVTISLPRLSKS